MIEIRAQFIVAVETAHRLVEEFADKGHEELPTIGFHDYTMIVEAMEILLPERPTELLMTRAMAALEARTTGE